MTESDEEPQSSSSSSTVVEKLTKLLNEEPLPFEYDIAILRSTKMGDPFVKRDGHLGLHAGDLPWLARDFRLEYQTVRSKMLLSAANEADVSSNQQEYLMTVTSCLLLVCPDHATAWADRKRALLLLHNNTQEENSKSSWHKELDFLNLLMTKHTKAPTSWFHRKYVFQQITTSTISSLEELLDVAKKEIQLCIQVADRYPKNYYAWTHRIYVLRSMQNLLGICQPDTLQRYIPEESQKHFQGLLKEELSTIEPWLRTHPSDHSAAHFGGCVVRMLLLPANMRLLNDHVQIGGKDGGLSIAVEAIESARRLVERYPTHEVLWIFRRICSHAFLVFLTSYSKHSGTLATATASMFWKKEIEGMLLEGDMEATLDAGNNSETQQEKMQSRTYQLSYVAWVLEYIWNNREKYQFLEIFDVGKEDISETREKALASLQCSDHVAHNVYLRTR